MSDCRSIPARPGPEVRGPRRQIRRVAYPGCWDVVADGHLDIGGTIWDVYLEHAAGATVPPGPNLRTSVADRDAEMARLVESAQ